jgi:RHS repeat-associated protein
VKANGALTRQYEYNAKGEQVRAYLDTVNAYFVYDEAGHLLGEYDNDGTPKQQLLWFGDLPIGVLQGSGTNQTLHYIEPDHLGTPRAVIDGTRNVAIWEWKLTGEAFGNTPPNQDPDQDGTAFKFDLRFPGQRYDSATGMNYNYFRDCYDPTTGRYCQSDPIGLNGGVSTFTYAASAPFSFFDLLGLACQIVTKTSWTNSYENHRLVGDPLRITWPILGFSYTPGITDFMPDPGRLVRSRLWFSPPISPQIIGY